MEEQQNQRENPQVDPLHEKNNNGGGYGKPLND